MAPTSSSYRTSNGGDKFSVGQIVWCLWMGRYYKARILQKVVRYPNFQRYYMVHYIKFSRSWDSGVAESRLLSCTKENNKSVQKSNLKLWHEIKERRKMEKEKLELTVSLLIV
uniref:Tudor-knot domain-containing protein n=1 Tax=Sipha flava TaxID=143950 RepID=A0A2S2PZK9_9HEMI